MADLVVEPGDVRVANCGNLLSEVVVQRAGYMEVILGFVNGDSKAVFLQVPAESPQVVAVHASTIAITPAVRDMTIYDTELIMKSIAITGTRSTGHRSLEDYASLFEDYLGRFSDSHFYLGGAKGIDSLALVWLAGHAVADLTVVVPGTVEQQPAEARQAIARSRDQIREIVELGAAELRTPAYYARNRWMVDHADMTIGFPHRDAPESSGSWQTLNYTGDQGKPRLIVPV